MNPAESNWRPIVARDWNMQQWTHGSRISQLSDLYSPSIFGANENLRCECGKLSGSGAIGDFCTNCEVFVTADIQKEHRRRVGRMDLAAPIRHPLMSEFRIHAFPIAPICYRRTSEGLVNALGRKYETLVSANFAEAELLGPRNSDNYLNQLMKFDSSRLSDAIRDIIGVKDTSDSFSVGLGRDDSLLSLIMTGLATLQPDVSTLLRCCGIVLQIQTAI